MTVKELCEKMDVRALAMPDPGKEILGGYAGDLLSWVMGNASHGVAWFTIMTNRNIVAVAGLLEMACIVVTEGSDVPDEVIALAEEQGINLLATTAPTYEGCAGLSKLL